MNWWHVFSYNTSGFRYQGRYISLSSDKNGSYSVDISLKTIVFVSVFLNASSIFCKSTLKKKNALKIHIKIIALQSDIRDLGMMRQTVG